ncbi:MAG: zinc ribbon domain-containing protein [Desulfobulbaceae bacterium]|nr:MAG: zinc ribbon domain-containing protein [Desulfobulbaceae bacterium]
MKCPKCDFEQDDVLPECRQCGVIFAKFFKMPVQPIENRQGHGRHDHDPDFDETPLQRLLWPQRPQAMLALAARSLLLLFLLFLTIRFSFSAMQDGAAANSFLHLVNLPFHETGHIFFRPLGPLISPLKKVASEAEARKNEAKKRSLHGVNEHFEPNFDDASASAVGFQRAVMTSLVGTLAQILMPLICLFVLLFQTRDPCGGAVCLWWFGEDFQDIAPYIDDARSLSLPLLGGNFGYSSPYGFHDWQFILTELGLLRFDHVLARMAHLFGVVMMCLALGWGVLLVVKGRSLSYP